MNFLLFLKHLIRNPNIVKKYLALNYVIAYLRLRKNERLCSLIKIKSKVLIIFFYTYNKKIFKFSKRLGKELYLRFVRGKIKYTLIREKLNYRFISINISVTLFSIKYNLIFLILCTIIINIIFRGAFAWAEEVTLIKDGHAITYSSQSSQISPGTWIKIEDTWVKVNNPSSTGLGYATASNLSTSSNTSFLPDVTIKPVIPSDTSKLHPSYSPEYGYKPFYQSIPLPLGFNEPRIGLGYAAFSNANIPIFGKTFQGNIYTSNPTLEPSNSLQDKTVAFVSPSEVTKDIIKEFINKEQLLIHEQSNVSLVEIELQTASKSVEVTTYETKLPSKTTSSVEREFPSFLSESYINKAQEILDDIMYQLIEEIKALEKMKKSMINDEEYHQLIYNILINHKNKHQWIATTFMEANSGMAGVIKIVIKNVLLEKELPDFYKKYYTDVNTTLEIINLVNCSPNKTINPVLLLNDNMYKKIANNLWNNYNEYKITKEFETNLAGLTPLEYVNDPVDLLDHLLIDILKAKKEMEITQNRPLTILEQRQLVFNILQTHESKSFWICNNLNEVNNINHLSNRLFNVGLFCLQNPSSSTHLNIMKDFLTCLQIITKGHMGSWSYGRMFNFLETQGYNKLQNKLLK